MKKLLLFLFVFIITIDSKSQEIWTEYSTAQPRINTGTRSISIVDQNTTWLNLASGESSWNLLPRYAKTVNGGSLWVTAPINLGIDTDYLQIANIHAMSSTVAYASVFPFASNVRGGIWKTEDGGTIWTKQSSATFSDQKSYPDLVYFWNDNEGVTVGDAINGYFEIYTTASGGNTWTRIASSPTIVPIDVLEFPIIGTFKVFENTIWVGTSFGRILKSADKGLTWTVSQSPIPDFGGGINSEIFGIDYGQFAFTDLSNGLLITDNYRLFKTNDGGIIWTEINYTGVLRNFNIASVPGMSNAYISVGEDGLNSFERGSSYSIDGGLTWVNINNNPDTNFVPGYVVAMLDVDNGFASGYNTSPTVGGVFKWEGGALLRQAHLALSSFSEDKEVTVYPNPTSGVLQIKGKNIKKIEVTDMLGKQIKSTEYNASNILNLNLDFLSSGIYILRIINDEGTTFIKINKQ